MQQERMQATRKLTTFMWTKARVVIAAFACWCCIIRTQAQAYAAKWWQTDRSTDRPSARSTQPHIMNVFAYVWRRCWSVCPAVSQSVCQRASHTTNDSQVKWSSVVYFCCAAFLIELLPRATERLGTCQPAFWAQRNDELGRKERHKHQLGAKAGKKPQDTKAVLARQRAIQPASQPWTLSYIIFSFCFFFLFVVFVLASVIRKCS